MVRPDELPRVYERLAIVERKLSDIYKRMGWEEPSEADLPAEEIPPVVLDLVQKGKTLEAVKAYDDLSGCGLAEAKKAVDQIAAGGAPSG